MLAEIRGGEDSRKDRAVGHVKCHSEGRRWSAGSVECGLEGSLHEQEEEEEEELNTLLSVLV